MATTRPPYVETRTGTAGSEVLAIAASDGVALTVTRFGNAAAPATLVYLPTPVAEKDGFAPVITEIDRYFQSGIAQLAYDHRNPGALRSGRAGMSQLIADLDTVLAEARGRVVLVAHSFAAIVLQEWLHQHRRDPRRIDAIVAVSPVCELPDQMHQCANDATGRGWDAHRRTGEPARVHHFGVYANPQADLAVVEDELRAMPTWIVTGRTDQTAPFARVDELAATVWAELVVVDDADHDLIRTHPGVVTAAITDALSVVHDIESFEGLADVG